MRTMFVTLVVVLAALLVLSNVHFWTDGEDLSIAVDKDAVQVRPPSTRPTHHVTEAVRSFPSHFVGTAPGGLFLALEIHTVVPDRESGDFLLKYELEERGREVVRTAGVGVWQKSRDVVGFEFGTYRVTQDDMGQMTLLAEGRVNNRFVRLREQR